jgi:hypothetical protein
MTADHIITSPIIGSTLQDKNLFWFKPRTITTYVHIF